MKSGMIAAVLTVLPTVASAAVIEFEDVAPASAVSFVGSAYTEAGFDFTTNASFVVYDANEGNRNVPDSGTDSLLVNGGLNSSITMTSAAGPFDVLSMLVSEGRNVGSGFEEYASTSLVFTGQFATGGTVVSTFFMDQMASDRDPGAFELVTLSDFTGLTSLSIQAFGSLDNTTQRSGYSFGIDSISVADAAVPVPAAAPLMLAGLGALGLRRRRKPA